MPAKSEARSQRNDRYGDVVPLASVIGRTIKNNRYCEYQEART